MENDITEVHLLKSGKLKSLSSQKTDVLKRIQDDYGIDATFHWVNLIVATVTVQPPYIVKIYKNEILSNTFQYKNRTRNGPDIKFNF
jgi:hypothetical protein